MEDEDVVAIAKIKWEVEPDPKMEAQIGRMKKMLGDGVHLRPTTGNDAAGEALHRTTQQVYFAIRDTSGEW